MRIALTGAHGAGKSTLAEEIAGVLGLPVLPTPGRLLAKQVLPINEDATVASQTLAWLIQYRFERERDAWVAPRSLIDVWAYTVQAAQRGKATPLEVALLEELERSTPLAVAERYDRLVYIPPVIPLRGDGVRPTGERFRRSTDTAIVDALRRWGVAHVVLDVTDRAAVGDFIDNVTGSQDRRS